MSKLILKTGLLFFLLIFGFQCFSQKLSYFVANVRFKDKTYTSGFLYQILPDTLVIIEKKLLINNNNPTDLAIIPKIKVAINDELRSVSIKRHNSFLRNIFIFPLIITSSVSGISYLNGDPLNNTGRPRRGFITLNGWEQTGIFVGAVLSGLAVVYTMPFFAIPRVSIGKSKLSAGYNINNIEKFSLYWQQQNLK